MFEKSIAERTKLRKERSDEIKSKEQKINNELFKVYFTDDQSPSNMYKKLRETKDTVNVVRVDSKLQRILDWKDDAAKIEKNEKMIDIVQTIL